MSSVHLEARNLTKSFGAFKANDDVSVRFHTGTIHAIIGENGAGKSTLMKMLFGLHTPDKGEILLDEKPVTWKTPMDAINHGIGMVQQHFSLVPPLSAIDNIILGAEPARAGVLDRKGAIEKLVSELPSPKLEVPWFTRVENLSVGEKQRVEILKLIYRRAKLLILDEPTAVLTPQEVEDLFEILRGMKRSGHTVVIISHKLPEIFTLCDEYTVLRAGRVTARGKIRDTSPSKIVEAMMGKTLLALTQNRPPRGMTRALKCESLRDEKQGRGHLKGISLEIFSGEIVGVAGVEGAGQQSLIHSIMGLKNFKGSIEALGQSLKSTAHVRALGVGYVPEDRLEEGLWPTETGYHNMIIGLEERFTANGFLQEKRITAETGTWAQNFDVRAAGLNIPASSFSGGNQQKLIFAREVSGRKPKLLICHQPTRGVDLGAVHGIHETLLRLRGEGLAILVVSSDLDELTALADRIYVLAEGVVTGEFARAQFDIEAIGQAMTGANQP